MDKHWLLNTILVIIIATLCLVMLLVQLIYLPAHRFMTAAVGIIVLLGTVNIVLGKRGLEPQSSTDSTAKDVLPIYVALLLVIAMLH